MDRKIYRPDSILQITVCFVHTLEIIRHESFCVFTETELNQTARTVSTWHFPILHYFTLNRFSVKMSHLVMSFIVLLALSNIKKVQNTSFAPQGCTYNNGAAVCDFRMWIPPLLDINFGPEPLFWLELTYINGSIPAQVMVKRLFSVFVGSTDF